MLTVPWSKPPMHRRRELNLPDNCNLQQRPIRSEATARLLTAVSQSHIWLDQLIGDRNASFATIAKTNKLSDKSVRATLSLAFLAPDIIEAAIEGRLHRGDTVTEMTGLPADWQAQRQVLGLA
jgi:site-specific DNA recombinase